MTQKALGAGLVLAASVWVGHASASGVESVVFLQTGGSARVTCMSLLSDEEVLAAVGRRGARIEKKEGEPGNSHCVWTWDDTESTLTVSFADAASITAMAGQTKCCPNPSTPHVAQFFDHAIRMALDLGAEPPAALSGYGQRAALFFEEGFLKLVVQRPDGVGQLVGVNVTREQLLAAGRALASP